MDFQEIRFEFDVEMGDMDYLEDVFKKTEPWLNIRLDENLKPYICNENENIYEFMDVSHLSSNQIENIYNSFFDFTFDNIVNVSLYKFLVLKKDDNKLTVLAIIHSSIFDYTSINKFTELFKDPENNIHENNILNHYNHVNNYLKSVDFKTDSIYWKNYFLNVGNYVKYYNIKSDDYKNIRIPINKELISDFLNEYDFCEFEFITAVFALYLTRVDRTKGAILKTIIPKDTWHSVSFDIHTLLKIPYIQDYSFIEYLNEIQTIYNDSAEYAKLDIDNYIGDILSYYEVYDFTKLENVNIFNGKGSAFTLNIYGDYLDLLYNAELFSDVYMKHMADNINQLINNLITSPNQIVNEIDILSGIEKDLLSDFCKGNSVDVDNNKTLAAAFRENAIKYPDFIAVDDGINQVTFAELEKSSNSVAYDLKYNYGVDFGECVGLMIPRNYHFHELVCALNKIGAVFTPIDSIYPLKRIEHMLNISEARYIITTKEYADNFSFNVDVIYIEDLNLDYDVSVECLGGGDDLIAIFFTSGTTGLPKAVMVSNKEISGCAAAFKNIFKSKPGDVVGSFVSFSFIASLRGLGSLVFAECCRIFNEMEQKDSLLLVKALKEQEMCDLILPPSIGVPIFENEDIKLKYLILAGAKLNELTNIKSNTRLVNFYGTTELILAIANIYDLNNIVDDSVPIGRPVANTWVYILDDNGMQMPIGVPGEICISNDFFSPGYYNQPDLTSSVFVDNPYCDCDKNRRLYHTGDIGFYNFNGEIEILGREDNQLSVRGFRVESNEVLNIMKSFDGIDDIYLDVDNDILTAYYTARDDLDIGVVKDSLNSELPYYMIPSLFVKLDKIPLNSNGKIDKRALKIINTESDVNVSDETLNIVLDAFRDVLSNDSVLLDDNLVELGGTSLSAMNLQRILKEELGVSLSSSEIIDLGSPVNIANHIKYNLSAYSSLDVNYTFEDKCPLSESQLNVYLDEKVKDMGTAYNNPFKIQFKKKYSFHDVENAIMKLWESYPVLSARVMEDEDGVSFNFDAEPVIGCGFSSDIDSFVKLFDLNKSLVRFLFVEDESLLCMDFHHLIFDGTSLNIILDSLLDNLNANIVDFVDDGFLRQISMEENVDQDYMDNAGDFFEEMLADLDETYDLLDCVKLDDNDNGEYVDIFDVDSVSLDSFLKECGVTYNQFFCGVFAYTLSRFTGSSKVSFNLVEDGRGHVDLSESVGMFVRTLPLLVDCKNQVIDSFIKYCGGLVNQVMFYDLYPFRLLARDYDLNSNILFQYSYDLFSNALNNDLYCLDELEHDVVGDLSFFIFNADNDKLGIRILYSDKYSSDFVSHFARSYNLILKEMLSSYKLSDIGYISDDDVLLLDEINKTEHDLFYNDVLDAFNGNLSKYPDNMLVSYNNRSYSYGEGAFIADMIAEKLVGLGVGVSDCVAFLVPRSELYMFCILGVLSCGGVYVPLDDALPDERIKFMISDTGSDVVIVSDETYDRAKDLIDGDVVLFNISDIMDGEIGSLSILPVVYGDLACILYTSGTTGVPKGVKVTRKSIINFSEFYLWKYDLSENDIFALFASIGFDVSMEAIFTTIFAGACLNIIPNDIKLDMCALNEYFVDCGVTYTHLPAQVAKLFIAQNNVVSLKVLCVGGEKLGEIQTKGNNYRFVDSYGPTETFIDVTSIDVDSKIDDSSIGHLFNNIKAYILDNEFRRVPVGAVGELYLAGYQIAEGYLNRPEETDKSFLDNPFDEDEYGVLYRTGDMVRILPDGSLGLVGRRDGQVKIRGNRVELGEVESIIRDMDDIEDVTVQTVKNNDNNELVAYIVSTSDLTNDELSHLVQNYVGEIKPDYMVPSFVISLDEIPLNINGKVDKRSLPEVDFDVLRAEYVAPTNETEKHIVDIFESVFNQKGIGLYDDFVRLGGDSISAIRVSSLLEKNSIHCSARDILNYKKPYLIAQHVNENIETIHYDTIEGSVDLLPIQSYFFDQVNLNNYTQEFVLKFNVGCDRDILQKSFDELCNIHDMLRARYKIINNNIKQEILPLKSTACNINEYSINDDFEGNMRDIFVKSAQSMDIENKLLDVNLVHYGDVDYLLIVIHHLIVDGVSWNILLSDLTNIYYKLLKNERIDIIRPYPYKMWVDNVKNLVDNISDDEKHYWLSVNALLDDSLIIGPTNVFSFNVDMDFDVDNLLMLTEDEYLALAISRAYKKTYGMDIIFNRESYGRDDSIANLNRTVGWFTSQYPVPVEVNNGKDDVSLINDVYSLKKAFGSIKHLGLNYQSLIYTTKDLKYKHCPVTFNFLSNEFVFKNELFESVNTFVSKNDGEITIDGEESDSFGVTFNVSRVDDSYIINGEYASNTYISDKFPEFIDNVKDELSFIGNYNFDHIACALSESQLGVYLDEKVHDKSTAYSVSGIFECTGKSIGDVKDAIGLLVDKHPILKGRVLDTGNLPLLVCDSYPTVEIIDVNDYSELITPFDLHACLTRFFIIDGGDNVVVVYDMHHMISDATSRGIIERDLNLALNGKLDGDVDLGFVYASRDSYEYQFRMEYDNAYDFFNEMFADIDEVPSLLSDVDSCVGSVSLPIHDIREEVLSFVQSIGITVSSFLNAVFAYTYSRFTGDDKVYYTFTEHGRHDFYCQDSIGMFVRTIPILIDCSNKNIRDYLAEVSDLILEAMSNSFYPFRLLARDFDLSNNVTFEYNYDLNDVSGIPDDGVVFSDEADRVSELLCVVNDLDDGFVVSLSHFDKISQDTAERFVKTFKEVLVQFLDNDCLGDINYISDDDMLLLDKINETEHDLLYNDVLDAFNTNLAKYQDNILVSYNDRSYSYGEGAFIADRIAKKLVGLGVEIGDCVGFLVPRSELYMFCILGILSCGGVYVPLDDALPDERIKFMLEDTGSNVLIVSDETYNRAKDLVDEDVILFNIFDIIDGEIGSLSSLPSVVGDLACILYTSGTTGIPKGVKITRKSVVNLATVYQDKYEINVEDVFGLFTTIGFDAAILAVVVVLYSGACLSIVPDDVRLNTNLLNEYFISQNVSHTVMTSQVGKLFMENVTDISLDVLSVGGEKLGEFKSSEDYLLVDIFGPTEFTVFISSIKNSDKIDFSSVGSLNYNTKAYVLDNESRRVPVGAVGELYLAGYQIAEGYLNRPEETDKAFLDNPFDEDEYGVLYRTGDMVRILPDGSLGFVGRRDSQVKIRGNRVELSEVESVIRSMDAIEDVTVQAVKNGDNFELVSYVVVSEGYDSVIEEVIQDYVGEIKPDYMVPSFVISLDEIPLNVNGKVDKRALPEVDFDVLRAEYVAPANNIERDIVKAFEIAFNQSGIGVYDDFVRLGGDSLTAIKLLSHIKEYNVSVGDILSLRTPYNIAKNINTFIFDDNLYSLDSGCPLTEPQLNVYLDILANDKKDSYFIPVVMDISKEYSVQSIQDALNEILSVHPVLGMCVSDDFDVPYLVKGSSPEIIVESDVGEDFIKKFLTKHFDLYDSLSRFLIVENNDTYILFAVFHHIIFDALSGDVFKQDLLSILGGNILDVDDSFLSVSAFSQQIQNDDAFVEAEEFYESMLVDIDDAGVLLNCVLCDGPGFIQFNLDLDNLLFDKFVVDCGVSENVIFTSAFAYTLSRFTGNDKALFNIVENGRDRFNNYNSIGMFVNTLPLLVDCQNQNVSSFIDDVSTLFYGVLRYNYYPFRLIANKYDIDANIIFQYMPEWIKDNEKVIDLSTSEGDLLTEMDDLIADLSVEVIQSSDDYILRISYSDKYSRDFISHFAMSYNLILKEMLIEDNLSDINYITDNDILLLDKINETEHELIYSDVLEAFNTNLSKYSDNLLVSYNNRAYSYGEGAFIINEICNMLTDLGVVRQDFVALFVNRSEWYLLASMGVLTCGAIYVPIETTYPDERIILMLKDSQCSTVIVDNDNKKRMGMIIEENNLDINVLNVSCIIDDEISSSTHLNTVDVLDDDLACVLYTSGTTGIPKGVLVTRKAINNFVSWYVDETNFTDKDVFGMHCSYVFDMHTEALYPPVITGGSLCVVPEDIRLDLKALNDYYVEHNCTHTYITSQVGKLFAESGMETSIKLLCFGGMKLGELNAPDSIGPFESYGPSENLAISTSIFANDRIHHSSIGHFISNVKGYVLDDELRRVPIGAVGELYLTGHQLTPGYLNREEENKLAFSDNPFDETPGYGVLYRTGDMVRILPDGSLGIVGRRDSQVKIRGNRVELGEVESVIRSMDDIEDVTVQTVKNNDNNELVAYVVSSGDLTNDELSHWVQDYVSERKPDYMVPSFVMKIDEIPLNVNGKVDKHALPDVNRDSLHVEYVAPRNENEKEIVEAFEKAFNLDKISIYDDFIRLGGDSLIAVKLLNYIESDNVTMADIFTFRTPEAIAKNIPEFSFDLDIYSLKEGCPLNSAQINVFADVNIYNKVNAYHIPGYIPISKKYGLEKITDSLDVLLEMHPILSTHLSERYEKSDNNVSNLDLIKDLRKTAEKFGMKKIMNIIGQYGIRDIKDLYKMFKTIIKLFKGEYPYLVKGNKPPISVKSKIDKEILIDFFSESFDLYNYLSKFMIVESEESYYLFYMVHHIIFDAISAGVFKHDFMTLLDGGSIDFDATFLKSSAFTHQIKNTEKFDEADEFYQPILSDLDDVGALLEDNPSAEGYNSSSYDLELDKVAFKSFLRNAGISKNVLFTSVFSYTLSHFVNCNKVIFTIIENGRDRFKKNFIGMTSNVMPVVIDCKDQYISSYLQDVADTVYGVLRHSYYPILLLYQKYNFEINILFQYVPNWIADDFTEGIVEIGDINSDEIYNYILNEFSDFLTEFFVQIYENGDAYRLVISHSNKFSDKMVEDFANMYITILSNIINTDVTSSNLSDTLK